MTAPPPMIDAVIDKRYGAHVALRAAALRTAAAPTVFGDADLAWLRAT